MQAIGSGGFACDFIDGRRGADRNGVDRIRQRGASRDGDGAGDGQRLLVLWLCWLALAGFLIVAGVALL